MPDSGVYGIAVESFQRRSQIQRISGLKWIRYFVGGMFTKIENSFWIMPSESDWKANVGWLASIGIEIPNKSCYLAPMPESRGYQR